MNNFNLQQFNPTIYYAFDTWNKPLNSNARHHHDFFEISILLEGEAIYYIENKWQTVRGGEIILLNPKVVHEEKQSATASSHQLHIGIGEFQLEGMPDSTLNLPWHILPRQEQQMKIMDKAWQLINELHEHQFNLVCKGIVLEIIGLLLQTLEKEATSSIVTSKNDHLHQTVQLIITYIENNYAQDLSIEQLATTYFISPTYLSKIFKEITGYSPINYLIQVRLKQAYNLLLNDEFTIKEIAKSVGYEDAYHFSKSFKKQYGCSPSQFRNYKRL